MTKNEFQSYLSNFLDNDIEADIYILYKNNDVFIHKIGNPDDNLRANIIERYSRILRGYLNENFDYDIQDVYNPDILNEYNYFYDSLDSNVVANDLLNFNKAEILPFDNDDELSALYGLVIEFDNGHESIRMFKKHYSMNSVRNDKSFNIFKADRNRIKLIENDTVHFNQSIDIVKIGNQSIIFNIKVYEKFFGFNSVLIKKAGESLSEIHEIEGINLAESLFTSYENLSKSTLKKLSNLKTDNPIVENGKLLEVKMQVKNYLNYDLKEKDGSITINSKKELEILIKALNREYNMNEITKEKFETPSKKKLNTHLNK